MTADKCELCNAEYKHIQHPMKPLGVIMYSTCFCELIFETKDGVTITKKIPPQDKK